MTMRYRPTIIALAAVVSSGCASPPYWEPTKVEGWQWKSTDVIFLDKIPYSDSVGGWVTRNPETGHCTIYVSRKFDTDCVLAHEKRHCAGYDHPQYRRGFICQ